MELISFSFAPKSFGHSSLLVNLTKSRIYIARDSGRVESQLEAQRVEIIKIGPSIPFSSLRVW